MLVHVVVVLQGLWSQRKFFFWLLSEDTCNFIGVNWFLDNCEFKLINPRRMFWNYDNFKGPNHMEERSRGTGNTKHKTAFHFPLEVHHTTE
jgi:hypothetical protein